MGDLVYFRYFDTLPSFSSKIPIIQAWTVRGSFIQLTTVGELLTPALFLLTLVFAVIFHKFGAKWQFQNKRLRWIPQLMGVMLILLAFRFQTVAYRTPIKADPSEPRHKESVLPVQQWAIENSPIYKAKTFGLFLFHYQDWRRSQSLKAQPLSEAQLISLRQNLDHIYDVNQTSTPYFGLAKNCNVLFIQLEAFQEFLIDLTVDGTEVTPFLNQLKKRCLYWDHIYDVTYIGRTSDAEFIVHTGLYCDHAGASAFIHLDKDLITFPRLLKQAGYQTASIHGFHKDFWNRAHSHPFFGIDHLYFDQELQSQESLGLGLADKAVFSESVALMKSFNQPFYTLMISLTNHHPFSDYPKEYAEKFQGVSRFNANYLRTEYNKLKPGPELKSSMKFNTNYLRTANYTDDALRQL
ncbi:MAG: LTA synthase family protein, partial [Acidobacteria bacterium]|nr:LTA synthase family protein [Acidobacteriota bacterium]